MGGCEGEEGGEGWVVVKVRRGGEGWVVVKVRRGGEGWVVVRVGGSGCESKKRQNCVCTELYALCGDQR